MDTKTRLAIERKSAQFKRNLIFDVWQSEGMWMAIQVLVELDGFVLTARRLGVSHGYLAQILYGNMVPSAKTVEKIKSNFRTIVQDTSLTVLDGQEQTSSEAAE